MSSIESGASRSAAYQRAPTFHFSRRASSSRKPEPRPIDTRPASTGPASSATTARGISAATWSGVPGSCPTTSQNAPQERAKVNA